VKIAEGAKLAASLGLRVGAGHGLNYVNVRRIARLPEVEELNIGHSIISRAALAGLERAVKDMIGLISAK
jgi:pyridoxine 5-phosphate synthase